MRRAPLLSLPLLLGSLAFAVHHQKLHPIDMFYLIGETSVQQLRYALAHGGNPNATTVSNGKPDRMKQHPLHAVLSSLDSPEKILVLLKAGANVNARNAYGATPLFNAAAFGDIASVKVLVSHGANVNLRNYEGISPLFIAQHGWLAHGAYGRKRKDLDQVVAFLRAHHAR